MRILLAQRHCRWAAAFAFVLLGSVFVLGQTSSPPATDKPLKLGSITGRVVNESGQPLPNVRISVRAFGSQRSEQLFTDSEGKFEAANLEPVNYQVFGWLSAYISMPRDDGAPNLYRIGDSVRIVMIKGGVITGTVTTQSGDPVVGVHVRARIVKSDQQGTLVVGAAPYERMTDDRGVYRIYGLPSATYVVSAGGATDANSSSWDAYNADVPTYAPSSNRDTASEISVRAGEEINNVDIRYRGESGHVISGTVNKPQDSPMGFGINLTSAADGGSEFNLSTFQAPENRGFIFYGLDDGDYYLTARTMLPGGEWIVSTPKQIKVNGADVTGIELTTQPLGSISGQVVLEESKAKECTDKQPPVFTETQVSAWHKEDEAAKRQPRFVWSLGAPANADVQGNIVLKNLAAGDYYFLTRFSGKSWYLQSISLVSATTKKTVDATRVWTTVKGADRISGLKVTLAEGAGSLSGQIVLPEGESMPEKLAVYLAPAEPERAAEILRFYGAPVSPEGKFSLNNLAPGRYWILAIPALEGGLAKVRLPDGTETRAKLRRDAEAAKNEIEFKPCQKVLDYQLKY